MKWIIEKLFLMVIRSIYKLKKTESFNSIVFNNITSLAFKAQ